MGKYIATFWTGAAWADLNEQPEPFVIASDHARMALLAGRSTVRLRHLRSDQHLSTFSVDGSGDSAVQAQ